MVWRGGVVTFGTVSGYCSIYWGSFYLDEGVCWVSAAIRQVFDVLCHMHQNCPRHVYGEVLDVPSAYLVKVVRLLRSRISDQTEEEVLAQPGDLLAIPVKAGFAITMVLESGTEVLEGVRVAPLLERFRGDFEAVGKQVSEHRDRIRDGHLVAVLGTLTGDRVVEPRRPDIHQPAYLLDQRYSALLLREAPVLLVTALRLPVGAEVQKCLLFAIELGLRRLREHLAASRTEFLRGLIAELSRERIFEKAIEVVHRLYKVLAEQQP